MKRKLLVTRAIISLGTTILRNSKEHQNLHRNSRVSPPTQKSKTEEAEERRVKRNGDPVLVVTGDMEARLRDRGRVRDSSPSICRHPRFSQASGTTLSLKVSLESIPRVTRMLSSALRILRSRTFTSRFVITDKD